MAKLFFKVATDWQEVVKLRDEIARLEEALKRAGANGALELTRQLQSARARFRELTDAAAVSAAQISSVGVRASNTGSEADELSNKLKGLAKVMAGAFAVDKLKDFAMQAAYVRGEFQQLEASFKTLIGNKDKADDLMNQLIRTAATTPFQMSDVAGGAKQLLAYGVAAENVNTTLIRLGDIAAGLSIPLGDLTYLYGTTLTQGRLYTQDFNQFVGRGIPLAEELAKQFGVTKGEVKKLVEEGKVGFPQIEAAIISLTSQGGKFGGLMEAQSKTITGQISNIEDSIEQMYNEIGRANEGAIFDALSVASSLIEKWREIGKVVIAAAAAFGTYRAVLMVVATYHKIVAAWSAVQAFFSLAKAVRGAKDAMLLFNLACSANPVGLIISALGAAVSAFYLFGDRTDEAAERSGRFGEATEKAGAEVESLYGVLASADTTSKTYATTQDELIKKAEEYGIKIDKEKDKHQQLIEVKQELIQLMREEAIERERANMIDDATNLYAERAKEARESLSQALTGKGFNAAEAGMLHQLVDSKEIEEYARLLNKVRQLSGTDGWKEANAEFQSHIESILSKVNLYTQELGKNKQEQYKAKQALRDYLLSVGEAEIAVRASISATNRSAQASRNASEAVAHLSDEERRHAQQARNSRMTVDQLNNHLRSLIETYNNAKIGISIQYEEINPPEWMKKFSSKEAKKIADWYTAQFNEMARLESETGRKHYRVIGGVKMSTHDVGVRAGQYSNQAKSQEVAEEKAAAEKREKDKKKKKEAEREAKRAAKRAETERKQRAEEAAKKQAEIKKESIAIAQANKEAVLEAEKAEIDAMKDGVAKSKRFADFELKERLADIEKQKKSEIEKIREFELLKWEAENPKRSQQEVNKARDRIANSVGEEDLSMEQKKRFQALTDLAIAEHKRAMDELSSAEESSMNDYLSNYGTLQEKKLAVIASYNKKIANATTEGEKKSLVAEKKQALADIDLQSLKKDLQLDKVFGDLDKVGTDALKGLKNALESFIKTNKDLSPEQLKDLAEALERIKDEANERSPFTALRDAILDLTKAQEAYNKAVREGSKEDRESAKEIRRKALVEAMKAKNAALKEVGEYMDAARSVTDSLESMGVSIPESIKGAMEGLGEVLSGLESIDLTKPASIISGAFKTIGGVFKSVTSLFGSENREWEKLSVQYEKLSSIWDALIDKKQEYISKSYGQEAARETENVKKLLEAEKKGLEAVAKSRLNYRKKGDHSVWYNMYHGRKGHEGYAWKDIADGVSEVIGKEFTGMEDLIGLTEEQWEALVTRYPEYVANLDEDFLNYLNEIRGKEEAIKEATEAQTEKWTGFTKDSFVDEFISGLKDMDKSAEDFSKDLEKYMFDAMVGAMANEGMRKQLDKILSDFEADISDNGIVDNADELKQRYQDLAKEYTEKRDKLAETMGIEKEDDYTQEASVGAFQTMSQETGEELNGRFTALNITTDTIAGKMDLMQTSVAAFIAQVTQSAQNFTSVLDESRSIQAKSYLELAQINERQGNWDKPMKQMFRDITDIKNGLKKI